MFAVAMLLSVVWGVFVACFTDFASVGHLITERMTWAIVSLGLSGDLLLMLLLLLNEGRVDWWQVGAVIALSSVALLARSTLDFLTYYRTMLEIADDAERD